MTGKFRPILAAVVLLIAGCQTPQPGDVTDQGDRAVVTPEHLNWITDVQWTLERMVVEGRPFALTGDRPYIRFEPDGRVTGFGSVNRFFGLMQVGPGGVVRWPGGLASTRMAGPQPAMRQEQTFMAAVQAVTQWSIEGIKLYGRDAEGSTQLVFSLPTP